MAERRIIKGWIVERQPDGTLVPIAPAEGGGQMPSDPTFQNKAPKDDAELAILRARLNNIQADNANSGLQTQLLQAQAAKAQAEAAKVGAPAMTATERANAIAGFQSALALDKVIAQLEDQYKKGPGSTSGLGGIADYFPTEINNQFDSTGNAARGTVGQALGFTGGQLNSVQEAQMAVGPYLPQSSDRDAVILDKIARLKQVRDDAKARSVAMLGGVPDANGRITPVDPMAGAAVLPQAAGAHDAAPMQTNGVTAKGGLVAIPELAGYENNVIQMIGQGATTDEVVAYMEGELGKYGAAVSPELRAHIGGVIQKHQANPRAPVRTLGTGWEMLYHKQVPDQAQDNTFLGINPDSTAGNFLATGANAATGGLPAYLAGKQDVMNAAAQERPGSAMAGEIAGGTAAMLGIGKLGGLAKGANNAGLRFGGQALTRGGGIGGDMAYGATRGGFEDGPMGAVTGALAAGAGNKIGGGIAKAGGAAVRGVSSPAVRYLADKNIPMTMGQMLGNRGMIGRTMNKLESVPILGDALQERRMEGVKAFNEEAFKQAVDPINGPAPGFGPDGMDAAQQAVGQAYDNAYSGVSLTPDQQFAQQAGAAVQQGRSVPVMGEQFDYIMQNQIAPLGANGTIDGPRLQAALQSLKGARADFAKEGAMGRMAGDAVTGVEGALNDMVARQAPGVLPQINAANIANRNVSTLGDAVTADASGLFTPAQLRRSGINNTKKFGGRAKAARGDIPFRELVRYGQDVLPSTIPNSGTADRGMAAMLLPAALGGSAVGAQGLGEPKIAVPLGILAALSSKQGAKIAQKALTGRSDAVRAAGIAIRRQRRRAGLFGAATGVSMLPNGSQ